MADDGFRPDPATDKSLGDIVGEVSEKASLLVREEIELAKAEVTEKVTRLGKGAVAGAVAAVFGVFALFMLFNAIAWGFNDLLGIEVALWTGFLITFLLLVLAGALASWLAIRFFQRGAPPTPDLAIEEAKRTRIELERATESADG